MEKRTLASEWAAFQAWAVPAQAPAIQVCEMRMAFYAGAITTLGILGLAAELADDEAATDRLQALYAEAVAEGQKYMAGGSRE